MVECFFNNKLLYELMLLSRFSRVQLWATPQTAAHQAPPSLGFSRQEHCRGLPLPSPTRESEVAQSCQTPSDPMDCSPPGSSVPGIFQARGLEWAATAFSVMSSYTCPIQIQDCGDFTYLTVLQLASFPPPM